MQPEATLTRRLHPQVLDADPRGCQDSCYVTFEVTEDLRTWHEAIAIVPVIKTRTCYDEATAWSHRESSLAARHLSSWDVFAGSAVTSSRTASHKAARSHWRVRPRLPEASSTSRRCEAGQPEPVHGGLPSCPFGCLA